MYMYKQLAALTIEKAETQFHRLPYFVFLLKKILVLIRSVVLRILKGTCARATGYSTMNTFTCRPSK